MALNILLKATRVLSPATDQSRPRLVTIGFSHFSEKARWAMDLSPWASDYYEELHCPALHLSSTMLLMREIRVFTWKSDSIFQDLLNLRHEGKILARKEKIGVPKLVLPASYIQSHSCIQLIRSKANSEASYDSAVVKGGSSGILKLLSDTFAAELGHLYPTTHLNEVIELEHMLDTQFAPAVTHWDFGNILLSGAEFGCLAAGDNQKVKNYFINYITQQPAAFIERTLFKMLGSSFIVPLMIKANGVDSKNTAAAVTQIHQIFQQMDSLLAKNNPTGNVQSRFLLGTEQITAADIAFASFAATVLFPPQTAHFFPPLEQLRALARSGNAPGAVKLVALAEELQAKYRSAQYVLDLYVNQRFRIKSLDYVFNGPVGEGFPPSRHVRIVEPRTQR